MKSDAYALQIDDVGGGVTYVGVAEPGKASSMASWSIRKITETGLDISVVWAGGSGDFNQVYDNRAVLVYS